MIKQNSSKKCLAVVLARGGSKRLPGKNIMPLNGKPLIVYTIEAALNSAKVGRVIVSTDDKSIAEIAVKHGAETPFLRPVDIAKDDTPDRPVLMHAISWLNENEGYVADEVAILRPTTPLKTAEMIDACLGILERKQSLTSVRTVTKVQGGYHPYWMYKSAKDTLHPFIDGVDVAKYYQRQLLPLCYRLNGVVDVSRVDTIMNCENLYGPSIGFLEIQEAYAIDIDSQLDFDFCEFLMRRFRA